MISLPFVQGKTVGIVGLGKTGAASAKSLAANGAKLLVWDDRPDGRDIGFPLLDLTTQTPDFILWSPGIASYGPKAHRLALEARRKNIPLVSDIEIFAHGIDNDILAVTGTNGKSTTTALVAHILGAFRPALAGGNIGEAALALPELAANGVYVLELSSYQLELSPPLDLRGAILLNVTPDHLERHGDFDTYTKAKARIFEGRPGIAVICVDTQAAGGIADDLKAEAAWKVVEVSTRKKTGVYVENGILHDGDIRLDLSSIASLKGVHNHENAACAYALVRRVYEYAPQDIFAAMASFVGLPHRQHLVRRIGEASYINDSKATNADAASHALAAYDDIYWILGGQAKAGGLSGLEPYMRRVRHAFVIGEAAGDFAAWLTGQGVGVTVSGTLETALGQADRVARTARGAATVLLSPACASWDQFTSFEHRGMVFTDLVNALPERTPE